MVMNGVAEAPPVTQRLPQVQAGWSDCMYFFLFLRSFQLPIWNFRVSFCTDEGTVPYRSSAQMSCRGEVVGVSFVALGILEPQIARH
jgi:hypothetical protein